MSAYGENYFKLTLERQRDLNNKIGTSAVKKRKLTMVVRLLVPLKQFQSSKNSGPCSSVEFCSSPLTELQFPGAPNSLRGEMYF